MSTTGTVFHSSIFLYGSMKYSFLLSIFRYYILWTSQRVSGAFNVYFNNVSIYIDNFRNINIYIDVAETGIKGTADAPQSPMLTFAI